MCVDACPRALEGEVGRDGDAHEEEVFEHRPREPPVQRRRRSVAEKEGAGGGWGRASHLKEPSLSRKTGAMHALVTRHERTE